MMIRMLVALVAALLSGMAVAALNLNTATRDELVALPGIGPAKAQAIVEYRNQHGPFRTIDELRKVKGIGEKLFLQIKPELSVGPGARAAGSQSVAKAAEAKSAASRATDGAIARDDKGRK